VKSKIVRTDADLTPAALEVFTNITRESIIGRRLDGFTQAGVQSLAAQTGVHLLAVAPLLIAVIELADEVGVREVLVGEQNLFHHQLEANAANLLQSLREASLKQQLSNVSPTQVKVLLGSKELLSPGMTLLVSPYMIGNNVGGLLGIIGPQRLNYATIIPGLQFIAALLGNMLTKGLDE